MQSSAKCLRLLGPQSLKIALAQKKGVSLAKGGAQRFINLRQHQSQLPAGKTSQLSSSSTSQSVFSEFDNAAGAVASGVHSASISQQESSTSERKSSASTSVGLALGLGLTGALMLATRESEAAHAAGAPPTPSAVPPLQPGLTPLAPLGDHSTGPQTLNAGIPTAGVPPLGPGQVGSIVTGPGQSVNPGAGPLPAVGTAGAAGPFPPIAPLPGTQPPSTTTKKKVVKKRKKTLPNPGSIDKCAREVRNVTGAAMHIFNGARFAVNKRIFPAGADMPSGEPFAAAALQQDPSTPTDKQLVIGTTLMAGNMQESQDGTGVRWTVRGILGKNKIHDLSAETDLHGGVMTGSWAWKAIPSYVTVRNQFMIGSDRNSMHNQVEYRGSDFTTRLGVSNGGQKFDADYMQSVLPSLALGTGIQFEWNKQVHLTHALRYRRVTKTHPQFKSRAAEADTAFVIYKDREISAGYTRQLSPQVHLGSEVVYSPHSKESKCVVGMASLGQLVQMRSSIDTDGVVAVAMDQSLSDSMSFSLSAAVPHAQPQASMFGFGLQIIM